MTTKIWCLLIDYENNTLGELFYVFLENDANDIANFRGKVKEAMPDDLKYIWAHQLAVWRFKEPKPTHKTKYKQLQALLKVLDLSDEAKVERLESADEATDLGLDNEILIVQVPMDDRNKRKRDAADADAFAELEGRKRNKCAIEPPSFNAKQDRYLKLQADPKQNILDDRPVADCNMPPISLLYDGFGLFFDVFDGREDVDGLSDVDSFKIVDKVDVFAEEMCKFYPSEDERREKGLKCLNNIFAARKNPSASWKLYAAAMGSAHTDGHRDGSHHMATKISEFKDWMTGINSLPDVQLVSCFAHSQKLAMGSLGNEKLFHGWRIPCLGIVIVGCEVRFYGILTLGPKFRLVSLTPSISCINAASDGRERKALRRAFIAASVLHARIDADTSLHMTSPSTAHHDMNSPYLPAIMKIGPFEFEGLKPWHTPQPYRYLYWAETKSGQVVLVKFSPRYSFELHEFCAASGHAPALLAWERLPGGWYGIVMEYLPGVEQISRSPYLQEHRESWEKTLRELVGSFHECGLVHGDLRFTNIVCHGDGRIWLIDFDWAGKEGVALYPTSDLHPELVEGRHSDNLKITKEDDLRVLNITFSNIDQGNHV